MEYKASDAFRELYKYSINALKMNTMMMYCQHVVIKIFDKKTYSAFVDIQIAESGKIKCHGEFEKK